MMNDLIALLSGPTGGAVGFAFGIGCGAGYAFATKTALREAQARIAELKEENAQWRDRYLGKVDHD